MRLSAKILLIFLCFVLSHNTNFAQTLPTSVVSALSSGSSSELAKHFNSSIELIIINDENVYSKSQAEQIIKDFFRNNPPNNFTIIHQGGKDVSKFVIGELKCKEASFRITLFLSKNALIHQLRIEKDDV